VTALIADYALQSHPACEGWFAEQYRAERKVRVAPTDHRSEQVTGAQGERDSISSIYFLHRGDRKQAWRYLLSEEIFTFCTGSAIRVRLYRETAVFARAQVLVIDPSTQTLQETVLGATATTTARTEYQAFIPAGHYFTAEVLDETSFCLTGCIVAPGTSSAPARQRAPVD